MKKYIAFFKLTAVILMLVICCSGCGLLSVMGTLNSQNGTLQPTNPPQANDVIYADPNISEDITYSAVISNPDSITTTTTTSSNTTTTQKIGQGTPNNTTTVPVEDENVKRIQINITVYLWEG